MSGRKKWEAIIAGIMVVLAFTGCGEGTEGAGSMMGQGEDTVSEGKTYNGIDVSEEVELIMYLIGSRTPDFDEVYEEVNRHLKETVNATIQVEFLAWNEHDTKYNLLFTSGEEFDLIFTASGWAHYEKTAAMGGFYALSEEFIQTYAPDIWEVMPAEAWEQAKISGNIYMVPQNYQEFANEAFVVRGDLMEKYGFSDITTFEELKEFMLKVVDNEEDIYAALEAPWYLYFEGNGMARIDGTPNELFLYHITDAEDTTVTYLLDWEYFRDYAMLAKELYDAGCWSKDVLLTTKERQAGFLSGNTATMVWNLGTCRYYAGKAEEMHPEWEVTIVDPNLKVDKRLIPYINDGVALNVNSRYKERALMVLNELYTNPEVYDLTALGIEGKHWEAVGENQYRQLNGYDSYAAGMNSNWGWRNEQVMRTEFMEVHTTIDENYEKLMHIWRNSVKPDNPLDGFVYQNVNYASEIAELDTIIAHYYDPLINGIVDDVDEGIAALREQLEEIGIQEIYEDIKKQAEEYIQEHSE